MAFANFIRIDTCPAASTRCVNSALTRVTLRNGCDPAKNSDPTYPTLQRTPVLAGYVQLC